jgi:hypothetical protein
MDKMIEKKNKKLLGLDYGKKDLRLPARGGVFLSLKRYIKMSCIDRKLRKI